jgi:hypothetical protein
MYRDSYSLVGVVTRLVAEHSGARMASGTKIYCSRKHTELFRGPPYFTQEVFVSPPCSKATEEWI